MGQKRRRPKRSGASGWDIGKPPRTILHHVQARVNRRFCRKTASFVESGRSRQIHERFVNFYKYYQNIFSTVWIFAIILTRMRGYSSPTLLALTVLTKGAKHYEVHIRL